MEILRDNIFIYRDRRNLNEIKEEMKFEIYVAHINHMIRKEADDDEIYVQQYCEKNNIQFFVKRVNVQEIANIQKMGTEEAGRNIRYEFFEEELQKVGANKIAIAHNKNDKIETIVMNLLRGSGLSGLKGIEPIREQKIIRPLIECERQEIEQYCEQYKFEIYVAHINHMIREEAEEDEKYVQEYCKKNNLQYFVKRKDKQGFANYKKIGTEEAGRKVRYEFFEEVAQKVGANKIGTAHNKNDKIETIIMNLLRGSGVSGLKGI